MLLLYSFTNMEDMPSAEVVKRRLFDNPESDHIWFKVLQNYEHFKGKDFTKHITNLVSAIGI